MVFTAEEIDDIRSECFAEDVDIETPVAPMVAKSETLYKKSVKDKMEAFEAANKAATSQVDFKKTWKKVGAGHWNQKTLIGGAPPPKKSVKDLP